MSSARRYAFAVFVLALLSAHFLTPLFHPSIEGTVRDDSDAIAGAHVGWRGEHRRVGTDSGGRFRLPWSFHAQRIVANKANHRIASAFPTERRLTLRLEPLPTRDNIDYEWTEPSNCARCHAEIHREWSQSAHARSAVNPKFLSLYAGTDGKSPMQKTWNARAEHPDGAAVCATCHVPTLTSPSLEYDVREADGVHKSSIHCDYCHKIADAPTDKLGTRFGRDGLMLLRPKTGDQLFFGPLDDAVRAGESFAFAPFYEESRYCASCHEGIVFGIHAYGTYSEWLTSPAKAQGKQCQDCHMTPTGRMTNIAPGHGGIERDPRTLASHHTPGGTPEMLRQSLSLRMKTTTTPHGHLVEVEIVAKDVGHRVPTGFPDRHLILVVSATDDAGKRVEPIEGPRLPASAGKWSGFAGRLFAKQLVDDAGRSPTPFWLPIEKTEDTRLAPERPEQHTFVFPASATNVNAQIWYRRFWQSVADSRAWQDNDVLVLDRSPKR